MGIINKHITLDEIEIIRNSLDKLHEYHNSKSKFFSGDYPRITFEERIEEYKKNSTNLAEQRFKQANLNLTNCLNGLSFNTQNQLHSLLGSQGQNAVQNIANTLKIDDIVQSIIYDFVKVGSINEKLGIRPDPMINKCV